VGDYIQLTLNNLKSNHFDHNIDLHAATGALGSAAINKVKPGESVTVRFKLIKSGIFTYHCAPGGIMIPYHIVQGMTGAILVLPRDGLTDGHGKKLHYDRAYYIGENDFYIPKDAAGEYKKYDNAVDAMADTLQVMRGLIPTHMGFGGKAFAYTGKNALKAKVGENVLILHSQANNISSPHLIGGHADYVWLYGGFTSPPVRDLQTWFIPAGGAVAAMYKFRYPGLYVYLNHNIIKAVMLGAAAHFKVTGQASDKNLMHLVTAEKPAMPVESTRVANVAPTVAVPTRVANVAPQISTGTSSPDSFKQILATVEAWREAWSAQDVVSYFSHYAANFQTQPGFPSMEKWKKHKNRAISHSKFIEVRLSSIQVTVGQTGGKATVRFIQHFTNDRFNGYNLKFLTMVKENGSWKILRETVK
jgi:nitrite reductase (NO-forming)